MEFNEQTLPRAFELFGESLRVLSREVLRVIDYASFLPPSEIQAFLLEALPEPGPEYEQSCSTYRDDSLRTFSEILSRAIGAMGRGRLPCDVVGAIVFGSMAKGTNHIHSDIDVLVFTRSEDGEQIGYIFERAIKENKLNCSLKYGQLGNLRQMEANLILNKGDVALIVSPDPDVADQLQDEVKKIFPLCRIEVYESS